MALSLFDSSVGGWHVLLVCRSPFPQFIENLLPAYEQMNQSLRIHLLKKQHKIAVLNMTNSITAIVRHLQKIGHQKRNDKCLTSGKLEVMMTGGPSYVSDVSDDLYTHTQLLASMNRCCSLLSFPTETHFNRCSCILRPPFFPPIFYCIGNIIVISLKLNTS